MSTTTTAAARAVTVAAAVGLAAGGLAVSPASGVSPTAVRTSAVTASLWVGPHAVDAHLAADPPLAAISDRPGFMWLTNDTGTQTTVSRWESEAAGKTVPVVLYDIPQRDLGSYSAGGAASAAAYSTFIGHVAAGIGSHHALVVLEPDALGQIPAMTSADRTARYSELSGAVSTLKKANPSTTVLIDASFWIGPAALASSLRSAGVAAADGFVLNTANFETTATMESTGEAVLSALSSAGVHGKSYAVDTSRNGAGPFTAGTDGQNWCNPPGRALGHRPAFAPDPTHPRLYADLWVKNPGESDGTCKGGPVAGQFWQSYADGLIARG